VPLIILIEFLRNKTGRATKHKHEVVLPLVRLQRRNMEQEIAINTINATAFLRQHLFLQSFMLVVTDTHDSKLHMSLDSTPLRRIFKKIQLHSNATLIFAL